MKTRYPTDQIYHRWAHQQDAHRITNGSNLRAEGACLFSYAECIGIVTDGLTIISSYKWSTTTNKHQWKARQAANHHTCIYLPCYFPRDGSLPRLAQIALETAARILRNIDHGNKARTINAKMRAEYSDYCALQDFASTQLDVLPAARITTLQDLRALRDGLLVQDHKTRLDNRAGALANTIAAGKNIIKKELWHGIDSTLDSLRNIAGNCQQLQADYAGEQIAAPDYLGKLPAQAKKLIPKLETMRDARDAEHMRINAEEIARWRAGDTVHTLPRELPPMLRLINNNADIQTSWGASVPVTVAPALWQMVTLARANGIGCDDCGRAKVGDYTLDTVHPDGSITVGCHKIAYSELELIARQLKFI